MQTTSKAARQVERERQVWHSLRHEGTARYSDLVEVFTTASTSNPGARYTITHDTVTGAVVCNCPAGTHNRNCLHAQAVMRYLTNRAAAINNAADAAVRARQAEDDRQRDTAPLRRDNRAFAARFWR